MEIIMEIVRSDTFLLIVAGIMLILLLSLCVLFIKFSKLNKKYKEFMIKLGNGKNLEEDLETYMYRVEKVESQNGEITNHIKTLDNEIAKCIKKVGMVRYNAFKDVGSDLSFSLALLNDNNDGIVLNGIYSREMSNIYAKPIEKGKSTYTVSEEEAQAIQKAINSDGIQKSNNRN